MYGGYNSINLRILLFVQLMIVSLNKAKEYTYVPYGPYRCTERKLMDCCWNNYNILKHVRLVSAHVRSFE
uniref:Secreted protein n=1 Tax=Rhizophora mucronata TaxID=61149 RepID=A0A2P2N2C3_RHIMU